jgi:hypothetical protein
MAATMDARAPGGCRLEQRQVETTSIDHQILSAVARWLWRG